MAARDAGSPSTLPTGAIPMGRGTEQGCPAAGVKCSCAANPGGCGTYAHICLANKQTPAASLGHTPLFFKKKPN